MMSSGPIEPGHLLDLKLMPSWLKESATAPSYDHYQGDEGRDIGERPRDGARGRRPSPPRGPGGRREGGPRPAGDRRPPRRDGRSGDARRSHGPQERRPQAADDDRRRAAQEKAERALADRVAVRFVPHPPVLDNVVAQV